MTTNQELRNELEDFGDHLPVIIEVEGSKVSKFYDLSNAQIDTAGQALVVTVTTDDLVDDPRE